MTKMTFHNVIVTLREKKNTLILFHRSPDGDAVGSAFALRYILEHLGMHAFCVSSDGIPTRLHFLSEPYQAGGTLADIPEDFHYERIIAVDTGSPSQLGTLEKDFADKVDLLIDHHETGVNYAKNTYVEPYAAATGEILFDVAEALERHHLLKMTPELATLLYAAISSDTGGFHFSNTTAKTHDRAGKLLETGIDHAKINHLLFNCKTPVQCQVEARGMQNIKMFCDGRLAIIPFTTADKEALHAKDEDLQTLVDVARNVEGVTVAVSLRQTDEKAFRASMRAEGNIDVSVIAKSFGGGGHQKAAGCNVEADDVQGAMDKLVKAIGNI